MSGQQSAVSGQQSADSMLKNLRIARPGQRPPIPPIEIDAQQAAFFGDRGYTRGRCPECRRVYRWRGKPRLKDALCPEGHGPLIQTSRLIRGYELVERVPAVRDKA